MEPAKNLEPVSGFNLRHYHTKLNHLLIFPQVSTFLPAATPEETESPAITPTPTSQETPLLWAPLLALGAFLFFRKRE
jgi:hypothetical protein